MRNPQHDIRIGTLARGNKGRNPLGIPEYVRQIIPHGFESLQLFWWQTLEGADLVRLSQEVREAIGDADVTIPTLAMFGNPLEDTEIDRQTHDGWVQLIDHAHLFGAKVIAGGRAPAGQRALWGFVRGARLRKLEAWRLQIPTQLKRFGTIDAKEGI